MATLKVRAGFLAALAIAHASEQPYVEPAPIESEIVAASADQVRHEDIPEKPIEQAQRTVFAMSAELFQVELRSGPPPANLSDPDSGLLLGSASIDRNARGTGPCDASGTTGHFRIKDVNGKILSQGKVTTPGEGGDIEMDNDLCVEGGIIAFAGLL